MRRVGQEVEADLRERARGEERREEREASEWRDEVEQIGEVAMLGQRLDEPDGVLERSAQDPGR